MDNKDILNFVSCVIDLAKNELFSAFWSESYFYY